MWMLMSSSARLLGMGDAERKASTADQSPEGLADQVDAGEEWEEEVERRAEEMRSGRVQGVPWEEVTAEIKAKYGWV